jgi:hypothetical protein
VEFRGKRERSSLAYPQEKKKNKYLRDTLRYPALR